MALSRLPLADQEDIRSRHTRSPLSGNRCIYDACRTWAALAFFDLGLGFFAGIHWWNCRYCCRGTRLCDPSERGVRGRACGDTRETLARAASTIPADCFRRGYWFFVAAVMSLPSHPPNKLLGW